MNALANYKERYEELQTGEGSLTSLRKQAFADFGKMGIPTSKHEEWKYTRIGSVLNKEYRLADKGAITKADLASVRLPGSDAANELIFVNGIFSAELSELRSASLLVQSLEEAAANEFAPIVEQNLGHSAAYLKDGIHALNTALVNGAIFIHVGRGKQVEHPVYIYNITDARAGHVLAQPRNLVYVGENAQLTIVETYATIGTADSVTNQVMELAMERDARVEYYKIENDSASANLVSTTHFRQLGKSFLHTVTISLDGGIVRNNLNIVFDAEYGEAHLYGLYFPAGEGHIDNHTVVDNAKPHCFSNELYKGVLKDRASGVFNGKIFVRQDAQKTNAYQSNKNILLSPDASVNTKPQLEIFADDVKCSHGCTIGQLDEMALFYLRSRGIGEEVARSLLVHSFASDILEHIKPAPVKGFVEELIARRLQFH